MTTNTQHLTNPELTPISVGNAASMFRRRSTPNDPPYTVTVIKHNNRLVDAWKRDVLDALANSNGEIQCGRVFGTWQLFYDADACERFIKYIHLFPRLSNLQMIEIYELLQQPIEELWQIGLGCVSILFQSFDRELYIRVAEQKWYEFYKLFPEPLEREKLRSDYSKLLNGQTLSLVFDQNVITEIKDKIKFLSGVVPQAQNLTDYASIEKFKHTITNNIPSMAKTLMKLDNSLIDEWKQMVDEIYGTSKDLPKDTLYNSFMLFLEGKHTRSLWEYKHLLPYTHNFDELKEVFEKDMEEVCKYGIGFVNIGWGVIRNEIFLRFAKEKYDHVFSKSEDPKVWHTLEEDNSEVLHPKTIGIWSNEIYADNEQKANTMFNTRVIDPVY